ncbi:hypothetical protein ACGFX8_35105 [Streptomyces sp. NPDC048362]|uniref:hypothetical protein n=1 Tax=Streptomyces sp. NPDC048362 TaxID=3365539 RepID=UPI00371894F2
MDQCDRVVGEESVGAAGEREVVDQVGGGLLAGHGRHVVADLDALVEGGQDAELDLVPQGRLADQQAGQRAAGVHLVVGQHPDRFELLVVEQMCPPR